MLESDGENACSIPSCPLSRTVSGGMPATCPTTFSPCALAASLIARYVSRSCTVRILRKSSSRLASDATTCRASSGEPIGMRVRSCEAGTRDALTALSGAARGCCAAARTAAAAARRMTAIDVFIGSPGAHCATTWSGARQLTLLTRISGIRRGHSSAVW